MPRYNDEQLLEDIRRLAGELGHPPTLQEYREQGEYGATTLYERFGSYRDALRKAGFEAREPQTEVSEEELLEELHRLTEELGERPTADQMDQQGEYWVSTYQSHFESWAQAVEEAGYETPHPSRRVSKEALLEDLERVAEEIGGRPTLRDVEEHGEYGPMTYIRRFGSWNEALEAAGFEARTYHANVSQEEMIEELHRLADVLDKRPSMREMNEHGKYSPNTYHENFGAWSTALEIAFEE